MRKDERYTWTKDDDLLLVETVLRHVRNGGAAIDGCREFAEKTGDNRSVDAVKFRFHTQLKKQHATAYNIAKEQGKQIKAERRKYTTQSERFEELLDKHIGKEDEDDIDIEDVYILLKRYMKQEPKKSNEDYNKMERLNRELLEQVNDLRDSNKKLSEAFNEIEHDYKNIKQAIGVLKTAGLTIDIPPPTNTKKYKVDANGLVSLVE